MNKTVCNNNQAEETYDIASNLSYLDLFIYEILRMYPIVSRPLACECNTTTTVCSHIIEESLFDIQILEI